MYRIFAEAAAAAATIMRTVGRRRFAIDTGESRPVQRYYRLRSVGLLLRAVVVVMAVVVSATAAASARWKGTTRPVRAKPSSVCVCHRARVGRRLVVFAPPPPKTVCPSETSPQHADEYDRFARRRAVLRGQGAQGRPYRGGLRVGHRIAQVSGGKAHAVAVEPRYGRMG
uniref:Uncharacterized protein n=1 Tax=Sipha flava TaxID=143950 RepID=A0A2S2QKN7_9HEMI